MTKAKITETKAPKEWITSVVAKLCFQPGEYIDPQNPGFFLRVSPKRKAVYAYRFRDKDGKIDTGTIGPAAEKHVGGIALADAREFFYRQRAISKGEEQDGLLTLKVAFEKYMLLPKKGGAGPRSQTTLDAYRSVWNRCMKSAGSWMLADTKSSKWEGLLDGIKENNGPYDARLAFMIIKAIYHDYVERGDLPRNPVAVRTFRDKFAGKDSRKKRKTYIALQDLHRFFKNLREVPVRGFGAEAVRTLALTGWRYNGVLQAKFSDVDFETNILTVQPKSEGWKEYEGPIAISEHALAVMSAQKETKKNRSHAEYIYPGYRNSKAGYIRNIYGTMKTASEGLGWLVKPHDLRRTFATVADIVLDGNDRLIGRLLGHKQRARDDDSNPMTKEYIMAQLKAEVHAATKVTSAILMLAGELPVSDELRAQFKKYGLSMEKFELKDVAE